MAMHPATAISLSKALQTAQRRDAEHRRLRAEATRRKATEAAEPTAPRAWPLRLLRLGNAGSRA
jgi:hypothetical protein